MTRLRVRALDVIRAPDFPEAVQRALNLFSRDLERESEPLLGVTVQRTARAAAGLPPNSLTPFDASGGAFTLTLPVASDGDIVILMEVGGSSNTVTIEAAAENDSVVGTATLSAANASAWLFYDNAESRWLRIV